MCAPRWEFPVAVLLAASALTACEGVGRFRSDDGVEEGRVAGGVQIAQAAVEESNRWGANDDWGIAPWAPSRGVMGPRAFELARSAGMGWVRYWLYWNVVNPQPGVYDWSSADEEVDNIRAAGLNVYITIMWAPPWTTGNQPAYEPWSCMTRDGSNRFDATRPGCGDLRPDEGAFRGFVDAAVKRYGKKVRYWGFWNESHNPVFWHSSRSVVESIMVPGYQAANPGVVIVGPETDVGSDLDWVLAQESRLGRFLDVVSFHAYGRADIATETLARIDGELKPIVDRHAAGRPVWITEGGVRCASDPASEGRQADGLRELFAGISTRTWIAKFIMYRLKGADPGGDYGVIDDDDRPRPALDAIRSVLSRTLLSVTVEGGGTVLAPGIACGDDCSEALGAGTTVKLEVRANGGSSFAGWSGHHDCLDGVVTLEESRACTAHFHRVSGDRRRADLDGDGADDAFLYNAASGEWFMAFSDRAARFSYSRGEWSPGWSIHPAHLDGDSRGDLFLYNSETGQWAQALNDGAGGFAYSSGSWDRGWAVHVLRLDEDAADDVLLYNSATGVGFSCLSDGRGNFRSYARVAWSPGGSISVGKLDRDAFDDLFLYDEDTGIYVLAHADGRGGFTYERGEWDAGWKVTLADLDGDGIDDVFVYNPETGTWVQAIRAGNDLRYGSGSWDAGWQVHRARIDRSGRDSLFLYNPGSGIRVAAFPDARGGFDRYASGGWSPDWTVRMRDLNGDGLSDALLYNEATGTWFKALSDDAGGFSYAQGAWSSGWTL
jgi:hypothetical protein